MRIIAGAWRGHRLASLQGRAVRPTTDRVREAWFSALGGALEGVRVLDLFAGSGALGLEALSRGAEHVVFVESAARSLGVLRRNVDRLACHDRTRLVKSDVHVWLRGFAGPPFDLAFADPPYEQGHVRRLVRRFRRHPFARELWVEHRWTEALPDEDGARQRRYGDTVLSTLIAEPVPTDD